MRGTAILFQEQNVTFIEDIEHALYKEINDQCGSEHCSCKLDKKVVDFGPVSPVYWHEDEVDWDYGY
ncbi:hypothetical protein [Neobacillus soli]|uniref:hypothetical protein n=1 Tax=Neobacillus soli TaxID=220688 RepID=UPI0008254F46|nr:hypothetical protein [Neobacillus soli]